LQEGDAPLEGYSANNRDREVVGYILARLGCLHPFRLSRLLALAEIESIRRRGTRLTSLRYVAGPGTFYIEGFKELVKSECFEKVEGDPERGIRGCIKYTCPEPALPDDARAIIDQVIERYGRAGDEELNRMVVENDVFRRLASGE
jgi:hydroxypyruvate isomerase